MNTLISPIASSGIEKSKSFVLDGALYATDEGLLLPPLEPRFTEDQYESSNEFFIIQ